MDTKSKKFSSPLWVKAVASLLIVACVGGVSLQVYDMAYRSRTEGFSPTLAKTYEGDGFIAWQTACAQIMALRIGCQLKSEEHIKQGGALEQERTRDYWKSFFQERFLEFVNRQVEQNLFSQENEGMESQENTDVAQSYQERELFSKYQEEFLEIYQFGLEDELFQRWCVLMDGSDFVLSQENGAFSVSRQGLPANGVLDAFEKTYQSQLESLGAQMVQNDLQQLRYSLRQLEKTEGLRYYIESDGQIFSNVENSRLREFADSPISIQLANRELTARFGETQISGDLDSSYYEEYGWSQTMPENYIWETAMEILADADDEDQAMIWYDQAYVASLQKQVEADRRLTIGYVGRIGGMSLAALLCLLYLFCVCGRKKGEEAVALVWLDRVYVEINLALIAFAVAGYTSLAMASWQAQEPMLFWPAAVVCGGATLALLLSLTRQIKARTLLRNCLLWKFCLLLAAPFRKLWRGIQLSLHSGSVVKKAVWLTAGYGALCAVCVIIFPASIALIVAASVFVYRLACAFQKVRDGVRQVKNGNLGYQIEVSETNLFCDLAEDVNSIADGLNAAVENELKSERMKSELITNVSHDIRTPLTSVITYIDLLQKEGLDSENAPHYCEIIGQKAQRLKTLTDDLFEVSKAASGNIAVHLEDVDMAALVRQGLGELDDKVAQSGLDFRVSLPAEGLIVRADGRQLWRVMENLLSNVFKYAMPASRVYIEVGDQGERGVFTVKNISAYELNGVEPEKLIERFQRGDAARHSEGNGLGLAIAKNLTELQRGQFEITIDGDLFKASVSLPKGASKAADRQEEAQQPSEPWQEQPSEEIG